MRALLHDAHVQAWVPWMRAYLRARCREDEDGCWIWRLSSASGREASIPVMGLRGRCGTVSVRRISARLANKAPKRSQKVVTTCGKRDCVLPEHMRPIDSAVIGRVYVERGLIATGPTFSARKLAAARSKPHVIMSIERARRVRERYAELGNAKAVAAEFGLRHQHVHSIVRNKLWREPSPFAI